MSKGNQKMIEGLPSSYDVNYITTAHKKCYFCEKEIGINEIYDGEIIYIDFYDFSHTICLNNSDVEYAHIRKGDYNSPVSPIKTPKAQK